MEAPADTFFVKRDKEPGKEPSDAPALVLPEYVKTPLLCKIRESLTEPGSADDWLRYLCEFRSNGLRDLIAATGLILVDFARVRHYENDADAYLVHVRVYGSTTYVWALPTDPGRQWVRAMASDDATVPTEYAGILGLPPKPLRDATDKIRHFYLSWLSEVKIIEAAAKGVLTPELYQNLVKVCEGMEKLSDVSYQLIYGHTRAPSEAPAQAPAEAPAEAPHSPKRKAEEELPAIAPLDLPDWAKTPVLREILEAEKDADPRILVAAADVMRIIPRVMGSIGASQNGLKEEVAGVIVQELRKTETALAYKRSRSKTQQDSA
jgi:hypothetical protein